MIKTVFDECKKLYNCSIKKQIDDVKDNNKNEHINNTKYYCDSCNYETNDKGNFSHHKKSKKHISIINNKKLLDYESIKKERDELKNKLFLKDIEIKYLQDIINKGIKNNDL